MLNKELLLSGSETYPDYSQEGAVACFFLSNDIYIRAFQVLADCNVALCYSVYDYFIASHFCVKYPGQTMSEAIVLGGNGNCTAHGDIIVSTTPGYEDWYVWRINNNYNNRMYYAYYTNTDFGTETNAYVKAWVHLPKNSFIYQIRDTIYQGRRGTRTWLGFDRPVYYVIYQSGSRIDLDNIEEYSPLTSSVIDNDAGFYNNWTNGLYETYGPSSKPNSVILSI